MIIQANPATLQRFSAGSLEELSAGVNECSRCGLKRGATRAVPGEGDPHARLMLVGEGPGQQEDLQGRPFVGAAGQLLDKMLAAIALRREDVYIANIVKCRPPGNRVPSDDEALVCIPFLLSQIDLIHPEIVVCLGATALRHLIGNDYRITRSRGKWFERDGIRYLPTFHPAALLRDPSKKREAWEDFQRVRDALNPSPSGETPVQLRLGGEE